MDPMRLSLPRDENSVRRARRETRGLLVDAGCAAAHVDAVSYVVGELVTESVEHGIGPLVLLVQPGPRTTRVEVRDGLSLAVDESSLRSRTVLALAGDTGVDGATGGRTLWAELASESP
jgi:anti-sigma regulatory factor (Ser/Thr protein kinase)